ncbi:hypothetical protein GSH05_15520 [Burkholderia pseudomallei]|uniref:Uncharacterized protein n=8 Tax=pseudomallei group TaxID=111527 RepID=Q63LL2_BURPS|nr:hypothetical protein BMAA1211 [Burkholderia mallei ATCC 23344]AFI69350.1 hypothetical protein BP1026B_II1098 [Burkholderia pseudomallei 1026b]AUG24171.1 hypothetical protein CXQ84_27395 [Burkholderia pseudomallei]EDU11061.1 conserved hypothetical protein [Burkholderia pseudomallei 1655]EIF60543.1 hypothetical protein BP1026A_2777 [Burkholderia pseudomallei 1026a]EIF73493.1 hypothetical protein BP354E_3550 [Burkholderia pseudomallei 354e]EIF77865.1 hypothetical protein BP354A_4362 [Burkhold
MAPRANAPDRPLADPCAASKVSRKVLSHKPLPAYPMRREAAWRARPLIPNEPRGPASGRHFSLQEPVLTDDTAAAPPSAFYICAEFFSIIEHSVFYDFLPPHFRLATEKSMM